MHVRRRLLAFPLSREAFVATARATALLVDGVRLPVYVVIQWHELAALCRARSSPWPMFRRLVALAVWLLGAHLPVRGQ